MKYAKIIIDINTKNLDKIFHYKIDSKIKEKLKIGMRVFIPFGKNNKIIEGYVVGFSNNSDIDDKFIKSVKEIIDTYPIFDEKMLCLAEFMAEKYYSTLTDCIKCIIPKIVRDKTQKYLYINTENPKINELIDKIIKKNNIQSKVISLIKSSNNALTVNDVKMLLNISISPINTLEKNGIIKIKHIEIKQNVFDINLVKKTTALTPTKEQKQAIDFLKKEIYNKNKKPIVLHGVTGSGKTEVYLQLIDQIIKDGKQAIILVPEISLTPQTIERFISRFGKLVSVTHSRLSASERFDQWKKAKDGDISIMVGARSAIFTPFKNLGVIIIDEEHESTYKSESSPKYDTKEVAKKLSELTNCLVVLASATPSINTFFKASNNDYKIITLKNRVNNSFPTVKIIDMRKELANGNKSIFSNQLFNKIQQNLKNKMQIILFLNRRGHSTFVSCRKCGHVMQCKYCNVNYTYHSNNQNLICHYCNYSIKNPSTCPNCSSSFIKYFGVGTQKIEEETKKFFPNSKIVRMDLDTTSKKNSHQQILEKFKNGDADILIGTQMIAKGLDFPKVSLVGVIAADLTLNSGDYKSAENNFQLLTQVSGRAGRCNYKGEVLIQTYQPDHYSIKFAKENDYNGFYEKEIKERKQLFYPPFCNIFFIMLTGKELDIVIDCIYELSRIFTYYNQKTNFKILGPAPANIIKIKNQFRYKIIIKGNDETRLKNFVLYCVKKFKSHKYFKQKKINIILTLNPDFIQ